jgi:hypothetical protein
MDPFYYYPEYRVLVCKSCRYAIQPTRIVAHLRSKQHGLTESESEVIATQYQGHDLADPHTELVVPYTIVTPIEHLTIYRDSIACAHCDFVCRAQWWMKQHQRDAHDYKSRRGRKMTVTWTPTWCQQFFPSVG